MSASFPVLQHLSDGHFHSGERLAQRLGLSRTAVWKQVQRLQNEFGLEISAVRGRGYRLAGPLELFDHARISAELRDSTAGYLDGITLLASVPSTNGCAAADLPRQSGRARVWLAEHQTDGRGRRGRHWVSPFGENLYLSMAWRFELPMTELAGLSLVAGVVVAEALARLGLEGHTLKWPNDVLVGGRKLCGILVEASGEAGGPATAVIGVGVNFHLRADSAAQIDQPWTDLSQASRVAISRNRLAGILTGQLIQACRLFSDQRLAPFLERWHAFDGLHDQAVRLVSGEREISGLYRGIAPSGAMRLEQASGISEHHAGEVSLRKAGET